MSLIIISNRAPVSVHFKDGKHRFTNSPGGLATGLSAYIEQIKKQKKPIDKITWIGWPGATVPRKEEEQIRKEILKKYGVQSVFLSEEVMENFYEGFCNKTIWPLFHYFPLFTSYEKDFWEQYIEVNRIFCDAVLQVARPDDIIWVHDYHLMLLPAMLREKLPGASIGFFLHIPFPAYEVFRLLPSEWRRKIFEGLYGADLIGFHTHDYRTYFLRSTLRILGLPNHMGEVFYKNRLVKVDSFPMGIDYAKYHSAALGKRAKKARRNLIKNAPGQKFILSIDRQDYTKGILNRLKGFEYFLQNNPQWIGKIVLMMVIVPSRIGVERYQETKSNVDELIGSINGSFGSFEWVPIHYQYRSLSFTELITLYITSDVALITPLRDGMNLIAKEYIAARTDKTGVLILSEMAGASDELGESIIINPNNKEEISDALVKALEMDTYTQKSRIEVMQKRLMIYNVVKWADDFLTTLRKVKKQQERLSAKMLTFSARRKLVDDFRRSSFRMLFLDYDGTLVPFANHPEDAVPGKNLVKILHELSSMKNTEVVIVSGRDRHTLKKWFAHLPLNIVAEHGVWLKEKHREWRLLKPVRKNWKKKIFPIMNLFVEKLPGSYVEEKDFSVVFHYRKSDPAFAALRVRELMSRLMSFTSNMDVQILNSNHALEMRNSGIDKGVAAMHWLSKIKTENPFILAAGDDWTDEDLFRVMPHGAFSIKVGRQSSYALLNVARQEDLVNLLNELRD